MIFTVDASRVEADEVKAVTDEAETAALLADDQRALFTARVDSRTGARPHERLRLAVNPGRFHFFDRETGESLSAAAREAAGATA